MEVCVPLHVVLLCYVIIIEIFSFSVRPLKESIQCEEGFVSKLDYKSEETSFPGL
jgi:hypothetical protein